jgi:hypothetical protein
MIAPLIFHIRYMKTYPKAWSNHQNLGNAASDHHQLRGIKIEMRIHEIPTTRINAAMVRK